MSNNKDKSIKQQLITKLKEMFQLDQPELDFGLYKIMHAKADQISQFIESDLAEHIDTVFGEASSEDSHAQLQKAKEDVIAALGETAFDGEGNINEQFKQLPAAKPYLDALQASKSDGGTLSNSASIYDHLYRFFSRYYDSGDFLSRRHHVAENSKRAAPYAVPYDGREVYLHWANKDQYYIKTSESFNSYTFNLAEAIAKEKTGSELSFGNTDENKKVHFQLVDADEGEHNNVKENQARFFIIHAEQPVKLNTLNNNNELVLQFEYRADPNKTGQNNTWQKNKLKEAKALIFETLDSEAAYKDWAADLKTLAPTEKEKSRTLLAKYLKQYTARNTMDYFIHKDLGGFLSRELDFYIKNEIMHLDDIEQADAVTVESWLLKVRVLRQVAKKVISFLAQLEDFQKKLWLKKKFVTETNYCMTVDRIPEAFYEEILACEEQLREWEDLGFTTEGTEYTEAFLKENLFLVIDTGLFDVGFKECLLAEINDLDETTDGVLIHSENFQALNLMQERYREQVKCVYIDPPYNTGDDGFSYKDSYQYSSWLSMMSDRATYSYNILKNEGVFLCSIDDYEFNRLHLILRDVFGDSSYEATFIRKRRSSSAMSQNLLSQDHEYVVCFTKDGFKKAKGIRKNYSSYSNPDNDSRGDWTLGDLTVGMDSTKRPNQYYDLESPFSGKKYPANPNRVWSYIPTSMKTKIEEGIVAFPDDPSLIKLGITISSPMLKRFKSNLKSTVNPVSTLIGVGTGFKEEDGITKLFSGLNTAATKEIQNIFGGNRFSYAKPMSLVSVLEGQFCENGNIILDYFAGSGTTAHATINLNREDNGNRKYILVEMGEYFDTVLKLRIKKVVYSENWKDGKPVADKNGTFNGVSQCFKYNRLESYEDTINNLITTDQVDPKNLPDDYILNYLLETETAESPSLINIEQFKDPTNYRLTVKKPGSDEQAEQAIDLVETFNWLIGLRVEELDKWCSYDAEFNREKDPELPDDQNTRLFANKLKETDAYADNAGLYQLRLIEGWCCRTAGDASNTDKVLVVWRKLTDDLEKDAAILEAVLNKKGVNQADSEYDLIYINGSHGLQLSGGSKSRLMSLEETFMAKMWEDAV